MRSEERRLEYLHDQEPRSCKAHPHTAFASLCERLLIRSSKVVAFTTAIKI